MRQSCYLKILISKTRGLLPSSYLTFLFFFFFFSIETISATILFSFFGKFLLEICKTVFNNFCPRETLILYNHTRRLWNNRNLFESSSINSKYSRRQYNSSIIIIAILCRKLSKLLPFIIFQIEFFKQKFLE